MLLSLWGCSINPPLDLAELTPSSEAVELSAVPFHPQEAHHCGPASLLSQLEAAGVEADYESIVDRVYVPGLEGSLQVEMLAAARSFGRIAYVLPPEPEAILEEVEAGRPVLLLLNLGLPKRPTWHYALVVGFDPARNQIVLHSGDKAWSRQRGPSWLRRWDWAGRWATVLLAPGEWPAAADRERLLRAMAAFDESGTPEAAERAWRRAAEQWPGEPIAWLGLGNAAYRRGDLEAAAEGFSRALAIDSEDLPARLNLAQVLAESGRPCEGHQALGEPPAPDHPLSDNFAELEDRLSRECADRSSATQTWFEPVHDTGIDFLNVSGREDQLPVLDQNGQGVAVVDADDDGLLDLVFVNGATAESFDRGTLAGHRLYRNLGDWRFEDSTGLAGLAAPLWGTGVAVGDLDSNGLDDLLITGWTPTSGGGGSVALHLNRGAGRFEDVSEAWNLATVSGYATGATFLDADGDGSTDVFIARYVEFDPIDFPMTEADGGPCLYRGIETGCGPWTYPPLSPILLIQRDGRLEDVSASSGIVAADTPGCRAFQPLAADFDGDGDADVYVGCDVGPNLLFENRTDDGEVSFVERALELGAAVNADGVRESGMGIALLTDSAGGVPSLFVTNFSSEKNTLYRNREGQIEDASAGSGLDVHRIEMGWGTVAEDFDGDGQLDLAIANGHIYPQVESLGDPTDRLAQPLRLYRGRGRHRFEEMASGGGLWAASHRNHRGLVAADLDADGRPDLVVTTHRGTPELFRNIVSAPVRRPPTRAEGADSFRNQGYLSARDPRQFLAWAVEDD